MQRNYEVQIIDDPSSSKFLDKGYLKCVVTETTSPFRTRHFLYCVHCSTLGSSSWFFKHRKMIVFVLCTTFIENARSCFSHYENDIYSEVDYLFESGSLFKQEKQPRQTTSTTVHSKRRSSTNGETERLKPTSTPGPEHVQDFFGDDFDDESGAGPSDMFSQHVNTISRCLYDSCFAHPIFETEPIISVCQFLDEQAKVFSIDQTRESFV